VLREPEQDAAEPLVPKQREQPELAAVPGAPSVARTRALAASAASWEAQEPLPRHWGEPVGARTGQTGAFLAVHCLRQQAPQAPLAVGRAPVWDFRLPPVVPRTPAAAAEKPDGARQAPWGPPAAATSVSRALAACRRGAERPAEASALAAPDGERQELPETGLPASARCRS
jgi:hypothetical protein